MDRRGETHGGEGLVKTELGLGRGCPGSGRGILPESLWVQGGPADPSTTGFPLPEPGENELLCPPPRVVTGCSSPRTQTRSLPARVPSAPSSAPRGSCCISSLALWLLQAVSFGCHQSDPGEREETSFCARCLVHLEVSALTVVFSRSLHWVNTGHGPGPGMRSLPPVHLGRRPVLSPGAAVTNDHK